MDRAIAALDEALAGTDDVAEQLRGTTKSPALNFLRYPAEGDGAGQRSASLKPANGLAIEARRDDAAVVADHRESATASCGFRPAISTAAFAVSKNGNGAELCSGLSVRYPDTLRGSRVRRIRAAYRRSPAHRLHHSAGGKPLMCSCSRSRRIRWRFRPPAYPVSFAVLPMRRWHGITWT